MSASRRLLVFGGTGRLGTALAHQLEGRFEVVAPSRAECDLLTDDPASPIDALAPWAVINAAAWNDVDGAEIDSNHEAVFRLNREVPRLLAVACRRHGTRLIHVSTDYVFDGRARVPYPESAPVGPLQCYGRSKLDGELAVFGADPRALVARTSTLFGADRRHGASFVDAVLAQARERESIEVALGPVSSPTYAPDLALALAALLDAGAGGVVHVANSGACSRLELAREAVRLAGLGVEVQERLRTTTPLAARPAYSVLDGSRYSRLTGRRMRPWQEALASHLGIGAS